MAEHTLCFSSRSTLDHVARSSHAHSRVHANVLRTKPKIMNTNVTGTFLTPDANYRTEQPSEPTVAGSRLPFRQAFEIEPVEMTVFVDLEDGDEMSED